MPAWLMLLVPALAGAPTDLERAWYLAQSGRVEEARGLVVAHLEPHPDDMEAHRLYAWLLVRALRDAAGAEALYQAWHAREPEAVVPRIALANALLFSHSEAGPWCAEAESLLQMPDLGREARYWSARARLEIRAVCPGERGPLREDLIQQGERFPLARPYALRLRVEEGAVDEALAADLADLYRRRPWDLAYPGDLWRDARGPALETARAAALEAAGQAATSDEPMEVEAALRIFSRAGDEEARTVAEERLRALDPGRHPGRFTTVGRASWVEREGAEPDPLLAEISGACAGVTPEEALAAAAGYDARVPAEGPVRAAFERSLARLHTAAGQPEAALEASRRAWLADPGDPSGANAFAWEAACQGQHLEEALAAIAGAEAALPAYDPRGSDPWSGYDGWLADTRAQASAILDTHGWVLHGLGRYAEAAGKLQIAVALARDDAAVQHLHLGLCYDRMGEADAAVRELGRGLAVLAGEERQLELEARARLAALYPGRAWAPRGMDDWIALQAPVAEAEAAADPQASERIGERFEDLALTVDGVEHRLSEYAGVRVVDLWATWCGPCKRAMPGLEQLAREWADRGVTVISVSVDEAPEDTAGFLARRPAAPVVRAWGGPRAMRIAQVRGIPSLFVLDGEGRILHYQRGVAASVAASRLQDRSLAAVLEEALRAEE
ncbi:MAG: redoxin family protein [Pseudomonadota bacterium]